MYPLIFYLLFSLFIPYTTANSKPQKEIDQTQETFKQLNQLNKSEATPRECQHCLQYSEPKAVLTPEQESELFQKCAVDLCGPANKSPRYMFDNTFVDNTDMDPETINRFNEKVRPTVEKAIQAELDYDRQILDILAEKIKNPNEEWDKIAYALYENTSIGDTMSNNLSSAITPDTQAQARSQAYKDAHTFLKENYQEFLRKNKKTAFTEEDQRTIDQIGQELKKNNLDFIELSDSAYDLDDLIKKTETSFCVNKPNCRTWIHGELSNLHQRMEQDLKEKENTENIDQYLQYCQSIYNADVRDAQRTRTFKENLDEYKNRFLERALSPPYSPESKHLFGNYMNNQLNIDIPPSSMEDAEKALVEKIDSVASIFKYPDLSFATIARKIENNEKKKKNFKSCPSPIKERFKSNLFVDYTNTVYIGFFNCTFHEHGKQILAHELAHAMSHLFANNKLSDDSYKLHIKLRQCATQIYKTDNESSPKIGVTQHKTDTYKDKYKTEEDTADLVAYHVFQDDPTLMGYGAILMSTDDGNQYKPLKMLDTSYLSSNDYYGDSHSKPLLRVIMEAIHKRIELSPTCQQVVDIYSEKGINFKPCF